MDNEERNERSEVERRTERKRTDSVRWYKKSLREGRWGRVKGGSRKKGQRRSV